MFGIYFGHYLLSNQMISKEQYSEVMEAQKSARVKLGLLAVASGLLNNAQAEEVNQLQQQMDKRFGDIAVEKGYLTDAQVGELLSKQGDPYMTFIQAITDKGVFSLEEVTAKVDEFATANGYTKEEMDALKSGDLDAIVPIFMKDAGLTKIHKDYIALAMRNLMRLISTDLRVEPVKAVTDVSYAYGVSQNLFGDKKMFTGIFGESKALLKIASVFGREAFEQVDLDSLDAVAEYLNVSNGLFVSGQSEAGIEMDLEPPVMYETTKQCKAEKTAYEIPVVIDGDPVSFVFSVDTEVTVA